MKLDKIQVSGKKIIPKSCCQILLNLWHIRHMLALPWIVPFIILLAHKKQNLACSSHSAVHSVFNTQTETISDDQNV